MSQGQKLFERPKVRFSQPSEESSTNSEKPDEQFYFTSNKPRIRSIVTLDEPFKIYKNGDLPSTSTANVVNTNTQYSSKPTCIAQSQSDVNIKKIPSSNDLTALSKTLNNKPDSPNIQKSLSCTNDSQNITQKDHFNSKTTACLPTVLNGTENSKSSPSESNSKGFQTTEYKSRLENSATSKSCSLGTVTKSTGQVKTGTIPKAGRVNTSKIGIKHAVSKAVPLMVKKSVKKTTTVSNENVVLPKNPVSKSIMVSKTNRQREKTPGKGSVPSLNRNVTTAKTVSCGHKISKPGSKTWKSRTKSSPVKKTILRDVTGHPTNVYIGPGIARYYSQPFKISMEKKKPHIRPDIVSGEKLSRPEYNSIMCTIDELKKAQAEKFVTDVEHLPLLYRNLVNEKVSAALDFPPDEAIYKNLVDLSVNENQLPSRVTRSKDPEPRHRDIIPKLSDFFTPTYSEEYCTAVQIRPSSPEIFSNWSAFAISDKIFGWKHDMDQCY